MLSYLWQKSRDFKNNIEIFTEKSVLPNENNIFSKIKVRKNLRWSVRKYACLLEKVFRFAQGVHPLQDNESSQSHRHSASPFSQ
jgi:hypothetical protein